MGWIIIELNAASVAAELKMTTFPTHGQTIVFTKVPAGSYCTAGVGHLVGGCVMSDASRASIASIARYWADASELSDINTSPGQEHTVADLRFCLMRCADLLSAPGPDMHALILPLEEFLNVPQRQDRVESAEVRDYRHDAYRVWSPIRDALIAPGA